MSVILSNVIVPFLSAETTVVPIGTHSIDVSVPSASSTGVPTARQFLSADTPRVRSASRYAKLKIICELFLKLRWRTLLDVFVPVSSRRTGLSSMNRRT